MTELHPCPMWCMNRLAPQCVIHRPGAENLYDIARRVTDEVLGEGAYADLNRGNPDPEVQAAIRRSPDAVEPSPDEASDSD